jgi:hypothetical protein
MRTPKIMAAIFLTFIPLAILFPGSAYGSNISFSLRLYGGLNYISGGDLNEGLKGVNDYYAKYFWYFGLTQSGGAYNPVHLGVNFGGDFIIQITPTIGIGLGAGYLQGTSESNITFTPVAAAEKTTAKVSAVPLRLGMYFTLPAGAVLNVNFHVGLSYYLAKVSYDFRSSAPGSWEQSSVRADGNGLGFHGGLGFEFRLSPAVSFFLEGLGRYASISGFEGSGEKTDSYGDRGLDNGKLYYYKTYSGTLGSFSAIFVHGSEPSGSSVSSVREARIDFSGFSAFAGIIIHF